MGQIPNGTFAEIQKLCQQGDDASSAEEYNDAISFYNRALELLPKPIEDWEAATWIVVAIGDANFLNQNYLGAFTQFTESLKFPSALSNPFIHYRLGQSAFEIGNFSVAVEHLARAYMLEGETIFEDEDPKYLSFLRSHLPDMWEVKPN